MAFHAAFTAVMAVALCRLPQACLQVEARHGTDEGEAGGGDRHTDTHRHTGTQTHTDTHVQWQCAMLSPSPPLLPLTALRTSKFSFKVRHLLQHFCHKHTQLSASKDGMRACVRMYVCMYVCVCVSE